VRGHGLLHALDVEAAEIPQLEEAGDERSGMLGEVDGVRRGELLHARGEPHRVPLRGVVHAQVVADLAYDDLAGVDAHARREGHAPLALQLLHVVPQLARQTQGGVAGPVRVILVGNGGPEERHDAVARVLVDGALEAVDAVRQDREEAVEDRVPCLGVDALGEVHGALQVHEQHRHQLALALEGALGGEDLVGEVLGRVLARVLRRDGRCRCHALVEGAPAAVAEGGVDGVGPLAAPAELLEAVAAAGAEGGIARVLTVTARATHAKPPLGGTGGRILSWASVSVGRERGSATRSGPARTQRGSRRTGLTSAKSSSVRIA
jgi:hypothetical protein